MCQVGGNQSTEELTWRPPKINGCINFNDRIEERFSWQCHLLVKRQVFVLSGGSTHDN